MQKMGLNELRESYLKFFESKDHLRLQSFPLVPQNDPSILLINAGMTPLKPYFQGKEVPPKNRITTCQKCIRTPDIENVGKTARHGTFFEMLGNFSFGDYFKREAIFWAWEYFTKVLEIPEEKLSVSVYIEDDEAYDIWNKEVGLPKEKIFRMGKEDNFWEHGTGPCGPCSEIYYDRGTEKGCGKPECTVGCDCDRFIEIWNLVFTQFNKQEDGSYTLLEKKNIDTGMGLERLACVIQGVDNIFEVDTVKDIICNVEKISGVTYGKNNKQDVSIRVITDHIRSTSMMISDGVLPSNEGRGYVLRRLLRRAARHGRLLGIKRAFLSELADTVINLSCGAYPHMDEKREYILTVISIEEQKFYDTLEQGLAILSQYIEETKVNNKDTINADMVFKLHDTYGFPLDLTKEIANENSLKIDEEGFHNEMLKQKEKAREAAKSKEGSAWEDSVLSTIDKSIKTKFVGYTENEAQARIVYIINGNTISEAIQQDDEAIIILSETPFYAESGGQLYDIGTIESKTGVFQVNNVQKTGDGQFLHYGVMKSGVFQASDVVTAKIDVERRMATARNHTVTHLLQRALINNLGDHVNQSGSLVTPERLRFDFTHFSAIPSEVLRKIEDEVNNTILASLPISIEEKSIEDAKKEGATALFGEKYGSVVRVVTVSNYSKELCGGTHLSNTNQASLIKILSESGIAAGVRRIEALTGFAAIDYYRHQEQLINEVSHELKVRPEECVKRVETVSSELKACKKEIEQLKSKLISSSLDDIINKAKDIKGVKVICSKLDQMDMQGLRNVTDTIKNKLDSCLVILAAIDGEKVNFVATATKDVVAKGIHCGNIVKAAAQAAGGGGGGRPDMAQAGAKEISKIEEALKIAVNTAENMIK